ncbi:MAG: DUF3048 domain-containing protein [Coriobacteriia bacterium]
MTRSTTRVSSALALAILLLVPGCAAPKKATIGSPWPRAERERVVERPAEPPRWPLTGLPAPDEASTHARVVSVKIENSRPARPQTGLDQADVVYETLTEGGITRFNALFQSKAPAVVGPVRSARLSDTNIVPQYGALFAHVGGNSGVIRRLRALHVQDLDQYFNPSPYWRSSARSMPHNMYLSIVRLRALARRKGFSATQSVTPFAFERATAPATSPVAAIEVPFAPDNRVQWAWDASSKSYLRSIDGRPHIDKETRRQYRATNVIVLWTRIDQTVRDRLGNPTLEIRLTGSGRVAVFRMGRRYDGTWSAGASAPPVLRAEDGTLLRLSPGTTWVQVLPTSVNISTR